MKENHISTVSKEKIKLLNETYDKDIVEVVEEINALLLQRENIDKRIKYLYNKYGNKIKVLLSKEYKKNRDKAVEEINALLLQRENIDKRMQYLCNKADKENYMMIIE